AKQPRGRFGKHHVLAQQPRELAIGLEQRRALPADQMRLELAHEAGEQRRSREDQRKLHELHAERERYCHMASTARSATSAPNTRVRYARMVRNCTAFSRSAAKLTARAAGR